MAAKCASKTLFVGNLHASLEETDLLEIFRPYGRIVECCKRWCHYGFIQFATEEEARLAFNNLNGSRVRGRPMRIEFQRKKIRNLAALLEAEAQAKSNTSCNNIEILTSSSNSSDVENISPSRSPLFFNSNDIFASNKIDNQLVSQFAVLSEEKSINSPLPLGQRSLNTLHLQSNKTQSTFAREIAQNILIEKHDIKKENETIQNELNSSFDLDLTRFNYLLDKALQHPKDSFSNSSSSSSPTSSIHHKSATHDSSIMVYRSLNTSNTIFVQPTDILEPLEIGEFNEYKLFPSNEEFYSTMSSPAIQKTSTITKKWPFKTITNNIQHDPCELTPPSSVSMSSNGSSNSIHSPSPLANNHTRRWNIRRPLLK